MPILPLIIIDIVVYIVVGFLTVLLLGAGKPCNSNETVGSVFLFWPIALIICIICTISDKISAVIEFIGRVVNGIIEK
jgi:hypothetical protein